MGKLLCLDGVQAFYSRNNDVHEEERRAYDFLNDLALMRNAGDLVAFMKHYPVYLFELDTIRSEKRKQAVFDEDDFLNSQYLPAFSLLGKTPPEKINNACDELEVHVLDNVYIEEHFPGVTRSMFTLDYTKTASLYSVHVLQWHFIFFLRLVAAHYGYKVEGLLFTGRKSEHAFSWVSVLLEDFFAALPPVYYSTSEAHKVIASFCNMVENSEIWKPIDPIEHYTSLNRHKLRTSHLTIETLKNVRSFKKAVHDLSGFLVAVALNEWVSFFSKHNYYSFSPKAGFVTRGEINTLVAEELKNIVFEERISICEWCGLGLVNSKRQPKKHCNVNCRNKAFNARKRGR